MSYIEDVQDLLKSADPASVDYLALLDLLIKLEREHASLKTKIQLGLRIDMSTLSQHMERVWKIAALADRLRVKVEKKLSE